MKRFLAIIIAVMLIGGMLPASFAAETDDGNEWVFTSGSHGYTENTRLYTPASTTEGTAAWAVTTDGTKTEISDKWGFSNQAGLSDIYAKEDFLYMNINVTNGAMPAIDISDANRSNVKALSLNLTADTSGEFNPCLTYVTEKSGGIYEIYLVPDSEKALTEWTTTYSGAAVRKELGKIDAKFRMGKIDAYGNGEVKTVAFPKRSITAGNYHLVIVGNGVNENWVGDTTIISGRTYVSLKVVSFAMKDSDTSSSPFYDYNISLDTLTAEAKEEYINLSGSFADLIDNKEIHYVDFGSDVFDTTKTDGYDLCGRTGFDNSPTLGSTGFYSQVQLANFNTGTWSGSYADTTIATRPAIFIRLNVPVAGNYKLTLNNDFTSTSTEVTGVMTQTQMNGAQSDVFDEGAKMKVYFGKTEDTFAFTNNGSGTMGGKDTFATYFDDFTYLGEYDSNVLATDTTFDTTVSCASASENYYIVFDIGETPLNEKYWSATSGGYTRYRQLFLLSGIELTPVEPTADELAAAQEAYDAIVNENGNPAEEKTLTTGSKSFVKILSSKDKNVLYDKEHTAGETVTYTATGDDFLYWAQGMGEYKTVISEDAPLSIKAEKGAMYIYAVYAKDAGTTEVVFYNGNKAEISRKSYENGATITMEALPRMAGFENAASAWTCVEDGKEYTAEKPATASGKLMRFVAKYPDEADETFTVTAENGTADKENVTYGETVTVTAPLRKGNSGIELFNYWMKDGEIVSFDESYSFRVYKATTVTAVYKEYQPLAESVRKIILGTRLVGNETAIIAEFINVKDAVEKGIMFGGTSLDTATHKVAMKGTDNFFSVIDDVDDEAKGYAILSNGSVIYSE